MKKNTQSTPKGHLLLHGIDLTLEGLDKWTEEQFNKTYPMMETDAFDKVQKEIKKLQGEVDNTLKQTNEPFKRPGKETKKANAGVPNEGAAKGSGI